jgi:quercetin dioxygenase-like cupin family protein
MSVGIFTQLKDRLFNDGIDPPTDNRIKALRVESEATRSMVREATIHSERTRNQLVRFIRQTLHTTSGESPDIDNINISNETDVWTQFGEAGNSVYMRPAPEGVVVDNVRQARNYNLFNCILFKGKTLSKHRHSRFYETIFVLSGVLRIEELNLHVTEDSPPLMLSRDVEHTVHALETTEFILKFNPIIPKTPSPANETEAISMFKVDHTMV